LRADDTPGLVLVVDDAAANRELITAYLELAKHTVLTARGGPEALEVLEHSPVDLILLDVVMRGMDGFEVCQRIRQQPSTQLTPIIMITSLGARTDHIRALDAGADDFLSKPVDRQELLARVRSLLRIKRLTDQLESSESLIFAMARIVEAKDVHTEQHTVRVAEYARALAASMGMTAGEQDVLYRCGVVHDIGKIAISDIILLKPDRLTPSEFEVMKRHSVIGEEICRALRGAAQLTPAIRHHHEHWNGAGYPDGLEGTMIPLTARIVAICDAFDAMTTDRPYRRAMGLSKAHTILRDGRGVQWDADLVDRFLTLGESRREHPSITIARQASDAMEQAA